MRKQAKTSKTQAQQVIGRLMTNADQEDFINNFQAQTNDSQYYLYIAKHLINYRKLLSETPIMKIIDILRIEPMREIEKVSAKIDGLVETLKEYK